MKEGHKHLHLQPIHFQIIKILLHDTFAEITSDKQIIGKIMEKVEKMREDFFGRDYPYKNNFEKVGGDKVLEELVKKFYLKVI